MITNLTSSSAQATEGIGADLAGRLSGGDVLLLEGDLAAGKTTLVRGLVRALGGDADDVSSPTFVLLQSYRCDNEAVEVVHRARVHRARVPHHREGLQPRGAVRSHAGPAPGLPP